MLEYGQVHSGERAAADCRDGVGRRDKSAGDHRRRKRRAASQTLQIVGGDQQ